MIIKDDKGHTYLEIPVNVAAVGVIAVPVLAAVGAISALVAKFKIVVERSEPKDKPNSVGDVSLETNSPMYSPSPAGCWR